VIFEEIRANIKDLGQNPPINANWKVLTQKHDNIKSIRGFRHQI
jgi:hypothetical protein